LISSTVYKKTRGIRVSKGTIKKTVTVFVLLLMMTTLAAFLLEGIQEDQSVFSDEFVGEKTKGRGRLTE